jgi:hypothetical protein
LRTQKEGQLVDRPVLFRELVDAQLPLLIKAGDEAAESIFMEMEATLPHKFVDPKKVAARVKSKDIIPWTCFTLSFYLLPDEIEKHSVECTAAYYLCDRIVDQLKGAIKAAVVSTELLSRPHVTLRQEDGVITVHVRVYTYKTKESK